MDRLELRGFYFITDSELSTTSIEEQVGAAISGGARVIQYREKNKSKEDMVSVCKGLKSLCAGKAIFIVNDFVDVAFEADADGVHIGQEDTSLAEARKILGGKIIGVTVHDVDEAVKAEEDGADYLGVSPIFHTDTKKDAGTPSGVKLIRDIKEKVKVPVVAIGGINESNIDSVIEAGADMACAISATVAKEDIKNAVESFAEKITSNQTS
jgi:thiamine-phosphate pyrophosphorylase